MATHIFIWNRPFLEGATKEFRGFLATLFAKYSWQNLDWGKIDLLVDFLNSTYVCEQSYIETPKSPKPLIALSSIYVFTVFFIGLFFPH